MLARLPLRSKLILVVSIPLFVMLGFAGVGIANRLSDLNGQRQYSRLRLPNDALAGLQSSLENEGVLTTWYTATPSQDAVVAAKLDRARGITDRAVVGVRATGVNLGDDVSASTKRAWDALDVRLDTLKSLRRQADDHAGLPEAFGDRYGNLVDDTLDVSERMARDVSDRQLSDSMLGIVDLRSEQAASARRRDDRDAVPRHGLVDAVQRLDRVAHRAGFCRGEVPRVGDAARERRVHQAAGRVARRRVPCERGQRARRVPEGRNHSGGVLRELAQEAGVPRRRDRRRPARRRQHGGVARVRRVERGARVRPRRGGPGPHRARAGVDHDPLGQPVAAQPHRGRARCGRRAAAEPREHAHTGRRSESHGDPSAHRVVERRDRRARPRLQHDPGDDGARRRGAGRSAAQGHRRPLCEPRPAQPVARRPADLTARRARSARRGPRPAFLALRARPPRHPHATQRREPARALRRRPVAAVERVDPILDVVRAASGEIADFARVAFVGFEGDVAIAGNAVADVTHIMAELLENATSFSPPGSAVVVAGMLAERRFVVSITDEGIGMDDARLAGANALLQAPPPPGLSLSRTLGLHVVAHLARRYGIRVQLRRAATGGISAILALPATVFARLAEPESTDPPAPPQPPIETPPDPVVLAEPAPVVPPEPIVVPEPVVDPEPVIDLEPGLSTPTGWNPDAAPPPAGLPIVVGQPAPEPPVVPDVVTSAVVEAPVFEAPVFEAPVFEPVDEAAFESAAFQPLPFEEPELSVFDPNEFEVPFEPLVGAADLPDPVVVVDPPLEDLASTQAFAAAAWPEPEVMPPAFDPETPAPPAATPAEPYPSGLGQALFDGGDDDLPRRVPGTSPLGSDGEASTLPTRSPGRHLSHQPAAPAAPGSERDARPRPERVHDLLTRHLRGIRDGRGDDLTTHVPADHAETEASS